MPVVTRNHECVRWVKGRREIDGRFSMRSPWHCTTCHADADHFACGHCGVCMPQGPRAQRYCCTTCRVYAWKARETDNERLPRSSTVTHNTETERICAAVRATPADKWFFQPMPTTDEEWAVVEARAIAAASRRTASLCGKCGRDLDPSEPVLNGYPRIGVVCLGCAGNYASATTAELVCPVIR